MNRNILMAPVVLALATSGAEPGHAGGEMWHDATTQTGINAGSRILNGTVIDSMGIAAGRWVAEVWAGASVCLRLDLTEQQHDFETVVIAPDGKVYRNDNRSAADNRPLVKIDPTPNRGWYLVSIGHAQGNTVSGLLTLRYGLYNLGNPNCASPTPAK